MHSHSTSKHWPICSPSALPEQNWQMEKGRSRRASERLQKDIWLLQSIVSGTESRTCGYDCSKLRLSEIRAFIWIVSDSERCTNATLVADGSRCSLDLTAVQRDFLSMRWSVYWKRSGEDEVCFCSCVIPVVTSTKLTRKKSVIYLQQRYVNGIVNWPTNALDKSLREAETMGLSTSWFCSPSHLGSVGLVK